MSFGTSVHAWVVVGAACCVAACTPRDSEPAKTPLPTRETTIDPVTKKLEAEGIPLTVSYRTVPALDIAIAFIKDPWGTNIELTEGLADID